MQIYTKQELAMLYFPTSSPHVATNHLARWIRRCHPLQKALSLAGYRPKSRRLTLRQLRLIYEYLGEP